MFKSNKIVFSSRFQFNSIQSNIGYYRFTLVRATAQEYMRVLRLCLANKITFSYQTDAVSAFNTKDSSKTIKQHVEISQYLRVTRFLDQEG